MGDEEKTIIICTYNAEDIRRCTSLTQCSTITRFEVDIQVKIVWLGTWALFKILFCLKRTSHKMIKHHCNFAGMLETFILYSLSTVNNISRREARRVQGAGGVCCRGGPGLVTTSELLPNVAKHFYRTRYTCTMA